jgi:hypothetical protein
VLWALILVVIVNGIRAPFERFTSKPTPPPTTSQDAASQFPAGAASAYAMQFALVYLNYDQKDPAARATALAYFLPGGNGDPQFGWDGAGALGVQGVQVAGVDARDTNNGVVTLLVKASPQWLQFAVPVYAHGGKLVISGKPALLPPPPHADLPQQPARDSDADLVNQVTSTLIGFFTAYATGSSDLSRYSLPGGSVPSTGLGGAVSFVQMGDVYAPKGPADQRVLAVTVTWSLAGGKLDQTYQVSVVKKDAQWYVKDVRGATP